MATKGEVRFVIRSATISVLKFISDPFDSKTQRAGQFDLKIVVYRSSRLVVLHWLRDTRYERGIRTIEKPLEVFLRIDTFWFPDPNVQSSWSYRLLTKHRSARSACALAFCASERKTSTTSLTSRRGTESSAIGRWNPSSLQLRLKTPCYSHTGDRTL